MIAIIVSIIISLSILLGAFVSFSPSFKSLVEGDFRRKAQESAWSYASKGAQLIMRANSLTNPPAGASGCRPVPPPGSWSCKETLDLREVSSDAGATWTDTDHICIEISYNVTSGKINVDNVTPSHEPCP